MAVVGATRDPGPSLADQTVGALVMLVLGAFTGALGPSLYLLSKLFSLPLDQLAAVIGMRGVGMSLGCLGAVAAQSSLNLAHGVNTCVFALIVAALSMFAVPFAESLSGLCLVFLVRGLAGGYAETWMAGRLLRAEPRDDDAATPAVEREASVVSVRWTLHACYDVGMLLMPLSAPVTRASLPLFAQCMGASAIATAALVVLAMGRRASLSQTDVSVVLSGVGAFPFDKCRAQLSAILLQLPQLTVRAALLVLAYACARGFEFAYFVSLFQMVIARGISLPTASWTAPVVYRAVCLAARAVRAHAASAAPWLGRVPVLCELVCIVGLGLVWAGREIHDYGGPHTMASVLGSLVLLALGATCMTEATGQLLHMEAVGTNSPGLAALASVVGVAADGLMPWLMHAGRMLDAQRTSRLAHFLLLAGTVVVPATVAPLVAVQDSAVIRTEHV